MQLSAPFTSMPPSNAAWSLLRSRRVLVFAFMLSVALHLCVWLATPYFIQPWHEPAAARFDAMIVPIVASPAPSNPAPKISSTRPRSAAKARAPRQAPTPKSEARFAAPENAIAVERAPETGDEDTTITAPAPDEKTPIATAGNASGSAPASNVEALPPTNSVAAEADEPDPPPPELPSRISIAYKMTSSISNGVADYAWTRDGDRFEIDSSMQATGFIVGNFVGVLHQVSRGTVTTDGLQPNSYQIRRGDGPVDSADFLRSSNELKLTRAGEARLVPMPPLIQDMQSFLFQLAYDVPKMKRPDDQLEVLVTNGRKVYRHRFRQVGIESLQAGSGPVQAIHLRSEASDPEDAYEVWLAPDNYYLPVRIKFYVGRFPVELIATSIRTTP